MQLILLQKVTNLGNLGDLVDVKRATAVTSSCRRAVPATESNKAEFEAKRAEYEAKAQAIHADAEGRKAKLEARPSPPTLRPKASCTARLARAPRPSPPPACRWKERSHPGRRRLPQHRRIRRAGPPARRRRDHRQGRRRRRSLIPRRRPGITAERAPARVPVCFVAPFHGVDPCSPGGRGPVMFHAHS